MKRGLAALLAFAVAMGVSAQPWQRMTSLALSPDERWVATGGLHGEVLWREVSTGEIVRRTTFPSASTVVGLVWSADSRELSAVTADGTTLHWGAQPIFDRQVPAGLQRLLTRWTTQGPTMSGVEATSGGRLARGTPQGTLVVETRQWAAHGAAVTGLAWFADGQRLISCSYDGTLVLSDARGSVQRVLSF